MIFYSINTNEEDTEFICPLVLASAQNDEEFKSYLLLNKMQGILMNQIEKITFSPEIERVVSELLSFDLRGEYGDLLQETYTCSGMYIWQGDMFRVEINYGNTAKSRVVSITNFLEESKPTVLPLEFFTFILKNWKYFYLTEMGFTAFSKYQKLNHLFGVLLITRDKCVDPIEGNFCCDDKALFSELFHDAMKMCSGRFGVSLEIIENNCNELLKAIFPDRNNTENLLFDLLKKPDGENTRNIAENLAKHYVKDEDKNAEEQKKLINLVRTNFRRYLNITI